MAHTEPKTTDKAAAMKGGKKPGKGGKPPPLLGQHTDEVLRDVLNYSGEKLSDLKRSKVI